MLADDTNIYLDNSIDSLNNVLQALKRFTQLSGLQVNFDKSVAHNIGVKEDDKLETVLPVRWGTEVIETLGVKVPLFNRSNIYNINLEIVVTERTIKSWQRLHLLVSLRGRIRVIKSLLLSKLQYLISVLGTPDQKDGKENR